MADVTSFYDFRQVGSAQSVQLFPRVHTDRRPLIQDLPVQVDELDRLISFVLQTKDTDPSVTVADFLDGGYIHNEYLDEIKKCNEAGYSRIVEDERQPNVQYGYILVSVLRGFIKPKKEIDAIIAAQEKDRKEAERLGPQTGAAAPPGIVNIPGATRTVVNARKGPEVRKRTPPQRNVLPKLLPQAGPIRPRSPTGIAPYQPPLKYPSPRRSYNSRSPPPPPPFGGGASEDASHVSVGKESSLTRLLASMGDYDSMSDLFTVDVDKLHKAFPAALRTRDTQVVVAEMYFGAGGPHVEPEVHIEE
jgi:hypothetical protein